tara:strand:+ start:10063 stop:12081 length:2019 start_codon:yes stop_codon:yes gene_type:complete
MPLTLTAKQKQRIDTASNWTSANPVLLTGEIGIESDTGKAKLGDGSTAWSSLGYTAFGGLPKTGGTMTGAILGDNSTSASTPGYAFDGDANTGLLRTGADAVALVTGGTAAVSVDSSQNVVIAANLTVNGTTTTIDTQNLDVEDKNITIGKVSTPSDTTASGGGITLKGSSDKTITWTDSTDSWDFNQHVNIATGKEYKVNNVSVLSSTTLGTSVVGSSLTSVGTIGTGTWQGTVIAAAYLPDGTTSAEGVVQLEDSTSSTSTTKAATPASVKVSKDAADAAATTANAALPKAGGQISGNITCAGTETVDGRDLSVDGAKLDGIEASADVTDATNVNAAGAIMESDVDAKGDILAGTADNTVSRLAVGTDGYVLKADSSTTTGLAWGLDSATDSTKLPLAGGTLTGKVTHNYTSSLRIPAGTTAQRDASAAVGDFRWNTTLEQYEGYDGSAWGEIGGSGGTGAADLLDIASSSGTGGGSATFNGTAYRFKLVTKGTSTAVTPTSAEILTVSINGILQKPNDGSGQGDMTEGYVVSGTDIIFDSPPAASSDYFIVNMGAAVSVGNASTVTVADESSDTTCFPTFVTGATGNLAAKTGSNLTFNSSSGQLAATSFAGDGSALTGIAGATADGCLYENDRTLSNNYTIGSGKGAHCVGPLTISATLTINGRLVIS